MKLNTMRELNSQFVACKVSALLHLRYPTLVVSYYHAKQFQDTVKKWQVISELRKSDHIEYHPAGLHVGYIGKINIDKSSCVGFTHRTFVKAVTNGCYEFATQKLCTSAFTHSYACLFQGPGLSSLLNQD